MKGEFIFPPREMEQQFSTNNQPPIKSNNSRFGEKQYRNDINIIDTKGPLDTRILFRNPMEQRNRSDETDIAPELQEIMGRRIKTRARAYLRVSTRQQSEEGWSMDVQEKLVREYCYKNNYDLVKIYFDEGISGKDFEHRPGIKAAIDELKPHEVFITPSLSRLGRSATVMSQIIESIIKIGSKPIVLDINIDFSTTEGKLYLSIFSGIAQHERDIISNRVTTTMRKMSIEGTLRTKPRFGFRLIKNEKNEMVLIQDEYEQAVIQFIKNLIIEDPQRTVGSICKILDNKRIRIRKSTRAHWATVSKIMRDNDIDKLSAQNKGMYKNYDTTVFFPYRTEEEIILENIKLKEELNSMRNRDNGENNEPKKVSFREEKE